MSKKSNEEPSKSEKEYYKLNQDAVDRLVNANKKTAEKIPEAELKKYQSSGLSKIPVWIKACFIKFWFAGSICYFFYWGLANYVTNWLDLTVIFALAMGMVTDLLTKNVMKFISSADKEYYPYMMFTAKKYYTFVGNIAYAFLLMFCTIAVYKFLGLSVEPILFGIVYTAFDIGFVKIRNFIAKKIKKEKDPA